LKFHITPTPIDYLYLYTTILTAPLGFWLWPNRIQNVFGGRDEKVVKKNMVLTGIFQLSQIPAVLVGLTVVAMYLTGVINDPIYKKEVADKGFMILATRLYNPIIVGFIGAGALAASLSTAAALLHSSSALFSKNIVITSDKMKMLLYARMFTLIIAVVSLLLSLFNPGVLVYLLLAGYAGIIQLFPEFIIAYIKPGLINKYVAMISSTIGMITVVYFITYKPIQGIYEGFAGIIANLITLLILTAIYRLVKRV